MEEYAIQFDNVSKIYKLRSKDRHHRNNQYFYALKDISFKIPKGEVVGILGTNGSGKSTMSLLLAGISEVDRGEIKVDGEQTLVAINAGLNKQLTGLENINFKGALLGLSKAKIKEIINGVIEFAELGDFLYQPVKKYSSGMKSRLGFAISIYLDTEIIIIDEALSVGDKGFANKCLKKINELKNEGKTIIYISHSLNQIRKVCTSVLWIESGVLQDYGDLDRICDEYSDYIDDYNKMTSKEKKKLRDSKFKNRVIDNYESGFIDKVVSKMRGK